MKCRCFSSGICGFIVWVSMWKLKFSCDSL